MITASILSRRPMPSAYHFGSDFDHDEHPAARLLDQESSAAVMSSTCSQNWQANHNIQKEGKGTAARPLLQSENR
jgi:hypothetical protein